MPDPTDQPLTPAQLAALYATGRLRYYSTALCREVPLTRPWVEYLCAHEPWFALALVPPKETTRAVPGRV